MVAIAAIMAYAKTQVQPPVALKQTNQYNSDLNSCFMSLSKADDHHKEDSIFFVTLNRISIFSQQNKLSSEETDRNTDALLDKYVPLFLKYSFSRFLMADWSDADHNYMLRQIAILKAVKHMDNTMAINNSTLDSLSIIGGIIDRYRKARMLTRHTNFCGIENARSTINQANKFAKDTWLSHCTSLVSSLQAVKSNIALSHYNYVEGQVQRLTQYRYYSLDYYDNILVPQVDEAITEYENKAVALYGTSRNVDNLWARAKSYYNDAISYYEN